MTGIPARSTFSRQAHRPIDTFWSNSARYGTSSHPGSRPTMLDISKVLTVAACLAGVAVAATAAALPAYASQGARADRPAPMRLQQLSAPDLVLRIDRLGEEIRRLTRLGEQLQYRNQQLEQPLRRAQAVPGPGTQAHA